MNRLILTLNAGSSSLKFAAFPAGHAEAPPRFSGQIAGIPNRPKFAARGPDGAVCAPGRLSGIAPDTDPADMIEGLLGWIGADDPTHDIVAVGHRVVHGGDRFTAPVLLTPGVMRDLRALIPLAPLHQPQNLRAIDAVAAVWPEVPQIACFDTAFHHTMPRLNRIFALPRALSDSGIRRYGFHGLSYSHIAGVLPGLMGERASGRIVVAHLGSGASMCAMTRGKSVATTMGFTALDGLMMGRRCGALDAGVVLHLLQEKGMSAQQVSDLLYQQSGLLGVSGQSSDMGALLADASPDAQEAVDLFCHRAAEACAGLAVTLGGLDGLIFTAGIGENAPEVRRRICARLAWLGVDLDVDANREGESVISTPCARIEVRVVATDEEREIATGARDVLNARAPQ